MKENCAVKVHNEVSVLFVPCGCLESF